MYLHNLGDESVGYHIRKITNICLHHVPVIAIYAGARARDSANDSAQNTHTAAILTARCKQSREHGAIASFLFVRIRQVMLGHVREKDIGRIGNRR